MLKTADTDNGIVKVDHQLNDKNRLSVRYNIEDARDLNQLVGNTLDGGGIGAPSSGHNVFLRDQSLVGTLSTVLRSNLVNTGLVQYALRRLLLRRCLLERTGRHGTAGQCRMASVAAARDG